MFDRTEGLLEFPSDTLIMRYIDDFIVISPHKEKVQKFAHCMELGSIEFGISINQSKTRFSSDQDRSFSWCGVQIDCRNLDISPDYSNFHNSNIGGTLTRDRHRHPGQSLMRQMQR